MVQADSVPTVIPRPITGAVSKASTNRSSASGWYLVPGRADPRNPMVAQRCWHATITGQLPAGYIVATIFVTAVILLAYWPWNILLILLLFSSSKRMLPWSFSEEAAAEKYMPQLQHNMWVVAARTAVLSVITGGGKWVEILAHADPLYQHLIVTAERKFWRCVESGEQPQLFGVEPPKPRLETIRIVDMTASNAWAEFAAAFTRTREAHLEHEQAKAELKSLVPEDAKEAIGHGVRAKRSKSGAISFDLAPRESSYAAI
jgi:hypothetical protein